MSMATRRPRVLFVAIVASGLAACGGRSRPENASAPAPACAPAPALAPDAPASSTRERSHAEDVALARAHALRLGSGVPRDYVGAASAYAELCRGGCGDAEACREYLHLAGFSRGAVLARADLDIAVRLCDRGDRTACQFASLMFMRSEDYDPDAVEALCAGGDRKACALAAVFDFEGTRLGVPCEGMCNPGPPSLGKRRTLHACRHGDGRACGSVISSHLVRCRLDEVPTIEACVDRVARQFEAAKLGSAAPLRDAWSTTRTLCAAGDVDACSVVPGREIPDADLCSAGDWSKCDWSTDPAQRRRGCAAGYLELCEPRGERSVGAMRLMGLRDRCRKGEPRACEDVTRETAVAACSKTE